MNKDQIVAYLVTNCSYWVGRTEALNGLEDAVLNGLYEDARRSAAMEHVVNAVAARDDVPEGVTVVEMPALVANIGTPSFETVDEWVSAAPPQALPVWNKALEQYRRQKADVITKLVGNARGRHRELLVRTYTSTPLEELLEISSGATTNSGTAAAGNDPDDGIDALLNFGGAASGGTHQSTLNSGHTVNGLNEYENPFAGGVSYTPPTDAA